MDRLGSDYGTGGQRDVSYFLKFAIAMCCGLGIFPAVLALVDHHLVELLLLIAFFAAIFIFGKPFDLEEREKRVSESVKLWNRPWWQCILLGHAVCLPAVLLNRFLFSLIEEERFDLLPALLGGIIISIPFGLFLGWHFKRRHLPAQSDSSGT